MDRHGAKLRCLLLLLSSWVALALAVVACGTRPSSPSAPGAVRLIVPYPRGGGADVWGRLVARKLEPRLGRPVVVENVAGEGGNRGTELAAHAAPDGTTLLLGSVGPLVVHEYTYQRLGFDPERAFEPVALLESSPLVLVVHPGVPASSVEELVAEARRRPGELSFATNGNGSPEQVAGTLFARLAGITLRDVPHDGAGPARQSLSAGEVTMMFDVGKAASGSVRAGKVRPLAVAANERSPQFPDVPTLAERGYPELVVRIWTGLFAPRGTPAAALDALHAQARAVLSDPEVRAFLREVGSDPEPRPRSELGVFLDGERSHWQRLVTDAAIRRVRGPVDAARE
jgi:tripartite-type tricarboxylate transporter receptor subunit TctC